MTLTSPPNIFYRFSLYSKSAVIKVRDILHSCYVLCKIWWYFLLWKRLDTSALADTRIRTHKYFWPLTQHLDPCGYVPTGTHTHKSGTHRSTLPPVTSPPVHHLQHDHHHQHHCHHHHCHRHHITPPSLEHEMVTRQRKATTAASVASTTVTHGHSVQ